MNKHVALHNDVVVCGTVAGHGICLRPPGHWGSHVIKQESGEYRLVHTTCWPISFPINDAVAQVAMENKDWSWAE